MKQNKGIIRNNQKKSDRNSDADKLDQICMALADIGYSFSREVYLVYDNCLLYTSDADDDTP